MYRIELDTSYTLHATARRSDLTSPGRVFACRLKYATRTGNITHVWTINMYLNREVHVFKKCLERDKRVQVPILCFVWFGGNATSKLRGLEVARLGFSSGVVCSSRSRSSTRYVLSSTVGYLARALSSA